MKKLMIAVLAVLLLVTISVGGVLPMFAEETAHVHSYDSAASVNAGATLDPTATQNGPDPDSYMQAPVPAGATPITSVAGFLGMEASGTYYLTKDISLGLGQTYADTFTGRLYGCGYTITTTVPLFSYVDDASIYDLVIEGEIEGEGTYVGAIAPRGETPYLYGVINRADITAVDGGHVGGFFGFIEVQSGETHFEFCGNEGDISNLGAKNDAGGFVAVVRAGIVQGDNPSEKDVLNVIDCYNSGNITGENRVGGLVGATDDYSLFNEINVIRSANYGKIVSKQHYCGGLFSRLEAYNVYVKDCINTGDVSTTEVASKYAGGLVGLLQDQDTADATRLYSVVIDNFRNEGDIAATQHAGGVVARFHFDSGVIKNCYNNGEITVGSDTAAGIVGIIDKSTRKDVKLLIDNCINDGYIEGHRPGGIIGCSNAGTEKMHIYNCTNNAKVLSRSNYCGGIACRTDATGGNKALEGFLFEEAVTFYNCVNNGEVECWQSQTGGMVGFSSGSHTIRFESCINTGKIFYTRGATAAAGGIAGNLDALTVFANCENYGAVIGGGGIGGIFGSANKNTTITDCKNYAEVKGSNDVGGILGCTQSNSVATIKGCLNTGYVNNTGNKSGGIMGTAKKPGILIENCANTGNVRSTWDAAGILGYSNEVASGTVGTIRNCVNTGTVSNDNGGGIAGIAGYIAKPGGITVEACVNTGTILSKGGNAGGILGYVWGQAHMKHTASLGEVKFVTGAATAANNFQQSVSALTGYQNDKAGNYNYNYFAGKLTPGANGQVYMVKRVNSTNIHQHPAYNGLFSTVSLPLYYNQTLVDSAGAPLPDQNETTGLSNAKTTNINNDPASAEFLNTLNAAAGAGTFVQVTTCEGKTFPIHKNAEAAFEMTRTHQGTYDYFTELQKDAEVHWFECGVCGTEAPEGKVAHSGGTVNCQAPANCATCAEPYGVTDPHTHAQTPEKTVTDFTHTIDFPCCDTDDVAEAAHRFDGTGACTTVGCGYTCDHTVLNERSTEADCLNKAFCGHCGNQYGTKNADNHAEEDTYYTKVSDTHCQAYHACCDTPDGAATEHTEGTIANCTSKATCGNCDQEYGTVNAAHHATPDAKHFVKISDTECGEVYTCCGARTDTPVQEHEEGTAANCKSGAVCANCNGTYGEVNETNHAEHTYSYAVNPASTEKHNKTYSCCGDVVVEDHSGGTSTCQAQAVCTLCEGAYGPKQGDHTYANACDTDCDVCGTLRAAAEHDFGEWTETKKATETEKGMQERTCKVCGGKQEASIPAITNANSALENAPEEKNGSDSWIGVIVVIVAALLVGGAIVAFVVHKRNKKKK